MSLATPACGEWLGDVCANNSPGSKATETIVDAKDSPPRLFQARQRRGSKVYQQDSLHQEEAKVSP